MILKYIKPYFQLARLHQPAGWLLLMWPCWFAVILAGQNHSINYYFLFIFMIGSIALRGAGCVVNDILDRDIDKQVERTKTRPLASGALNVQQAGIFLGILLGIGLFTFLQINTYAKILSVGAFCLALIYPLMKRFFGYPQLFLGVVFNTGAIICWAAEANEVSWAAIFLYVSGIFWTLAYDTIYGHQDKKDDLMIGVRSTAISFGKYNRHIIMACYVLTYLCMVISANIAGYNAAWFTLAPALVYTIYITLQVDLENPADCMEKFRDNAFMTGFFYFAGLYMAKIIY